MIRKEIFYRLIDSIKDFTTRIHVLIDLLCTVDDSSSLRTLFLHHQNSIFLETFIQSFCLETRYYPRLCRLLIETCCRKVFAIWYFRPEIT